MINVFDYLIDYQAQPESTYPYASKDQVCKHDPSKGVVSIVDQAQLRTYDPKEIMELVIVSPVTAGMDGSSNYFRYY